MAAGSVTPDEIRQMLRDVAQRLEQGADIKSVTLRFLVDDEEHEHVINVETEEERTAALLAIRTVLGELH